MSASHSLILFIKAKSKEQTSKIDKEAALNTYIEMGVTFSIIRNGLLICFGDRTGDGKEWGRVWLLFIKSLST